MHVSVLKMHWSLLLVSNVHKDGKVSIKRNSSFVKMTFGLNGISDTAINEIRNNVFASTKISKSIASRSEGNRYVFFILSMII